VLVPVITGATAVGKTRVATALAGLAPIEVVSADSRQVYRGLDIGTAKPGPEARAAAVHHGLDLIGPEARYAAGRFGRDAAGWITAIAARGRIPVVVGGTGFYLRALFEGLFPEPPMDQGRRERLRKALRALGPGELARWARRLDPAFRGGGAQRAARTAELALLAGRRLSELQRAAPPGEAELLPWTVCLRLERRELWSRIAARVDDMLSRGLIEEVRGQLSRGVAPDAPGLTGLGYREVVEHLAGRIPERELAAAMVRATRAYARRQETWFRHQLKGPVLVMDASRPAEDLAREVLSGYRAAASL
jgi:tRNA dimethylallyltransferase